MRRFLPFFAVVLFVSYLVQIVFRLNHWPVNEAFSYASWGGLILLSLFLVYLTWRNGRNLSRTALVMWTAGLIFVPVLVIPWWFLRIYPAVKTAAMSRPRDGKLD